MTTEIVQTNTDAPEMRAPADLQPGDRVHCDQLDVDANQGTYAEVLYTHSSHSVLYGGTATLVVFQLPDADTFADTFTADAGPLRLVSDTELEQLKAAAKRATFIAGLRELADWLQDNPWMPLDHRPHFQVDFHGDDAVAQVRELAARLGTKVRDNLDDRTETSIEVGGLKQQLIAWHKDGRPATEPEPELVGPREVDNGDQPAAIPTGVDGQHVGQMAGHRFRAHP